MGIAGGAFRTAPLLGFGLCAVAAVAYTVHWHQTNVRRQGHAPFSLAAVPGSLSVTAGATARYRIVIHRGRYRGQIRLTVAGAGLQPDRDTAGAADKISLQVRGQTGLLTVRTAPTDVLGRYAVIVKAAGGRYRGSLTVRLNIAAPVQASFKIAGNFGPLWPGTSQSVDLALTNPNSQGISVRSLTVAISKVSAPRATRTLPCSGADFAVTQFTGLYPLKIPAHATVSLSNLGVVAARGPQLTMLNRPVNQNGCQGATLTLSYSGTATSP